MAISNINYSNTFGQWVVSTNQTITEVNTLKSDNYTKTSGTLYLDSSSIGLSVSNNSLFSGNTTFSGGTAKNLSVYVPSYLYQPLTIASNTSISATGNISCSYSFANNIIANNATITRLNSTTITSNTITSNVEFANTIFTHKIDANNIVYKGLYTVAFNGNFTTANTVTFNGNFTTANNVSVTGNFPLQINVTANSNITLPPGANTLVASGFIFNSDINAAAAIVDTKLATIATAGKVSNSATTANSSNSSSTIVARDTNGDFSTRKITLAAATGTAPLTVTSNTLVTNLNADLLDGFDSTYFAANTENERISGQWTFTQEILGTANAANKLSTAKWFNFSGFASGSGSFDGTSNTNITLSAVANSITLGTDTTGNYVKEVKVSGTGISVANTAVEGGDFTITSNASSANGSGTIVARDTNGDFSTRRITLGAATGTAPLTVSSTTLVTNLNADLLDGFNTNTANSASTVVVRQADGTIEGRRYISTVATGTAPLTVSSNTIVTNLNADLLDGYHVGTSGATIPLLNGINTWSGNQIVNASLTVSGDLTISGNTVSSGATINDSGDYILRSNTGSTASPDSNFIIKRNSPASANANNATIRWDNTGLNWKINDVTNNNFYNVIIDKPTQSITGTWTFQNNVTLAATSAGDALRITQTGTGNALVVEDSANPDSTPFVIDQYGRVAVGANTPGNPVIGLASGLGVHSTGAQNQVLSEYQWSADGIQGFVTLNKSRGASPFTQTILNSGDAIGTVLFSGSDGTQFVQAARVEALVDGTPGTNDMPGRLVFSTTADGASTPTERMRIDSAGNVGIGGTAPAGRSLYIGTTLSGVSVPRGLHVASTVSSTGTVTEALGISSSIGVSGGTTLADLEHFAISQGTFSATTVTNQYGVYIASTLIGANNNFGFFSNIPSGTGRWNFYAAGTADNYFAGRVGIGGTPNPGSTLHLAKAITGATTSYGLLNNNVIQSDVTADAQYYNAVGTTAAAAFTLPTLRGYYYRQATFGAGSSVTNQYGFFTESDVTGATNNYGFYSNIPLGAGRWNFYANGTANNYLAGTLAIGSTTFDSTKKLYVTGDSTITGTETVQRLISTVATGTAPLTVASTTLVANLNADLLDGYHHGSFLKTSTNQTYSSGVLTVSNDAGALGSTTTSANTLQIYQPTTGNDAFQTFHIQGDTAVHFGLDGTTNDLFVGGWSMGAVKYRIWHSNNDGAGSGLDADLLDGYNTNTANSASTVVVRQTDGTIEGRRYVSTVATGVAPLTVTSTTVVTNLNADLLDGYNTGTSGSAIPILSNSNQFGNNQSIVRNDADSSLTITNQSSTVARYPKVAVTNYANTAFSGFPVIELTTARGTEASPSSVTSGQILGGFNTWGHNGTSTQSATRIQGYAANTFSTAVSAGLQFYVTNAGSQSEAVRIDNLGNVGIGTTNPSYKLQVNGSFAATTKSFLIDHPTKEGMKLRYGSLEGPENGVYIRGKLSDSNVIVLPEYWVNLIDENSITVNLTPIGSYQQLYVKSIADNQITIESDSEINCFYTVFAERKDVEKLIVEF